MSGPDQTRALSLYRIAAARYEQRAARPSQRYRRRTVQRLQLLSGEAVLDVACGTGANFGLLRATIGADGLIVGVDLSPEMLAVARERSGAAGWRNVRLIESAIEEADLGGPFDAALFSLTHDVLQSEAATANVARHLKAGARIASFGAKRAPRWRVPVNFAIQRISRRYVTTNAGFDEPWRNLARLAPDLRVEAVALGGAYIAWGTFAGVATDH
jgi:ubiquinone/menaquinone biosynthesis C-methylase UbiE